MSGDNFFQRVYGRCLMGRWISLKPGPWFKKEGSSLRSQANSSSLDPLEIFRLVWEAHAEWKDAVSFFNAAEEPDLIDYAIQILGAAELKYRYLLKQARCNQVRAFDPDLLQRGGPACNMST